MVLHVAIIYDSNFGLSIACTCCINTDAWLDLIGGKQLISRWWHSFSLVLYLCCSLWFGIYCCEGSWAGAFSQVLPGSMIQSRKHWVLSRSTRRNFKINFPRVIIIINCVTIKQEFMSVAIPFSTSIGNCLTVTLLNSIILLLLLGEIIDSERNETILHHILRESHLLGRSSKLLLCFDCAWQSLIDPAFLWDEHWQRSMIEIGYHVCVGGQLGYWTLPNMVISLDHFYNCYGRFLPCLVFGASCKRTSCLWGNKNHKNQHHFAN